LLPIILGVLSIMITVIFLKNTLVLLLSAIGIIYLLGYLLYGNIKRKSEKLLFDNHFLYIIDRSQEKKIPLKNIKQFTVKNTKTKIAGCTVISCTIRYFAEPKIIKSTIFKAFDHSSEIIDFENNLR